MEYLKNHFVLIFTPTKGTGKAQFISAENYKNRARMGKKDLNQFHNFTAIELKTNNGAGSGQKDKLSYDIVIPYKEKSGVNIPWENVHVQFQVGETDDTHYTEPVGRPKEIGRVQNLCRLSWILIFYQNVDFFTKIVFL